MRASLTSRALRALAWSFVGRGGQQVVALVVGLVLARLLLPEQFGLLGMLTVFIALSGRFVDSGLSAALIQKRDVSNLDQCSVFYFNIAVGVAMCLLLCVLAPSVAAFYGQPRLVPILRTVSLKLAIQPFGAVHGTILRKRLEFSRLALPGIITACCSGGVGIGMAFTDCGVWALVGQQLTASVLHTVLLWFVSPWRPCLAFSFASLRTLLGFGGNLLAASLIGTFFRHVYTLIIGYMYPPAALGFYQRAYLLVVRPIKAIMPSVRGVLFPALTEVQDAPERMQRGAARAVGTTVAVVFPTMVLLAVTARSLVSLLLTDKWLPCVPYVRILCISGMLAPLQHINLILVQAAGRSDLYLRLSLAKRTITVAILAVFVHWGVIGLVAGQAVGSVIAYLLNSRYAGTLAHYPLGRQLRDVVPYLQASVAAGVAAIVLHWTPLATHPPLLLAIQVGLGATVYLAICEAMHPPAYETAKTLLQRWRQVGGGGDRHTRL